VHTQGFARADLPPRLPVRLPAGGGVRTCLPGDEPQAHDRHLRLDFLHADRLPRPARDAGSDHADGHLAASDEKALYAGEPFRLRSSCVVLALCRRRLARPLHIRLLDVGRQEGAYSRTAIRMIAMPPRELIT